MFEFMRIMVSYTPCLVNNYIKVLSWMWVYAKSHIAIMFLSSVLVFCIIMSCNVFLSIV